MDRPAPTEHANLFESAFRLAGIGMAVVGLDGRVIRANAAFCRFLGYCEADILRQTIATLTHPDDLEAGMAEISRLVAGEIESYRTEKRYIRRDEEVVWGRLTAALVRDGDGAPVYCIAQVEDVTARKETELHLARLHQEHDRLAAIIEATPDLVAIGDTALNISYINRGGRRMLEIEEESDNDLPSDWRATAEGQRIMEQAVPRAIATGIWQGESRLKATSGRIIPVLQVILAHRDAAGRIEYLSTIARDISSLKELEQEQRLAATVFHQAAEGMLITDAEGRILAVNPAFTRITGYSIDEAVGRSPGDLLRSGVHDPAFYTALAQGIREKGWWEGEIRNRRKDGSHYDLMETISAVYDEDGAPCNFIAVFTEITERKRAEAALRREHAFSRAVIDSLPGSFYLIDSGNRFRRWNANLLRVTGLTDGELVSLSPLELFEDDDKPRIAESIQRVFREGEARVEADLRSRNGPPVPHLFTGYRVILDGELYLAGMGIDISDRKALEEQLRHNAIIDHLTGTYNRLYFDEAMIREVETVRRYHRPLTLILFDIDHFKEVNDTFGHRAGDDVLVAVAALAASICRQADTMARWGGEEFAVLCPETEIDGATQLAEKIRGAIESLEFPEIGPVTASFGVACFDPSGDTPDSLLATADKRLYLAKRLGRNRVVWT